MLRVRLGTSREQAWRWNHADPGQAGIARDRRAMRHGGISPGRHHRLKLIYTQVTKRPSIGVRSPLDM